MNIQTVHQLSTVLAEIIKTQNNDRSGQQYNYSDTAGAILKRIKEEVAKPDQQEPVPF